MFFADKVNRLAHFLRTVELCILKSDGIQTV